MPGYVAVTHSQWFDHLAPQRFWNEVDFWRPSAQHAFNGPPGSHFFFKLKAPHNAVGGLGLMARFTRLPDWLAWECFEQGNGAATFAEQRKTARSWTISRWSSTSSTSCAGSRRPDAVN